MKVQFYPAATPRPGLLAEVLIVFEEAGLWGLSLAGVSVWDAGEAGVRVSLPSRSYETDGQRRRYGFLRGDPRVVQRLKEVIAAEYDRQGARNGQSPGRQPGRHAAAERR